MRWMAALGYFSAACIVNFVANVPFLQEGWSNVPYPRFLGLVGATIYATVRTGIIMAWFSLLPAWWLAGRTPKYHVRSGLYFVGLLVFFAPLYGRPFLFQADTVGWRDLSVIVALGLSLLLALLSPWSVEKPRQ